MRPALGRRQDHDRDLRTPERGRAGPADVRLRLSDRGLAALEAEARRSRHGRAVRAVHRRLRSRQRLQRAQRSGRAAAPVRGAARRPRGRRPRSPRDGRGLHPRARVRAAADRRGRRGHRPPGDAADQQPVDPRRHPVPADAAARNDRQRRRICPFELFSRAALLCWLAGREAGLHLPDFPDLGARRRGRRDGAADRAGADDRSPGRAARSHRRLRRARLRLQSRRRRRTPRRTSRS